MARQTVNIELNRVEGDIEVRLEIEDDVIVDAWCVGSMYRGFEQLLINRTPADAMVISPRICGICSTAQLYAATSALEDAAGIEVAPDATRLRNLTLAAEAVMNDARHAFMFFAPDFCNRAYADQPFFDDALEAFAPGFKGRIARQTVEHTQKLLRVVTMFGGQWPHSTYMMPGGVTCPLNRDQLRTALDLVDQYTRWYEQAVLGCSSERWLEVRDVDAFSAWAEERPEHEHGALGLYRWMARSLGLHRVGAGVADLLSAGCFLDPDTYASWPRDRRTILASGLVSSSTLEVEGFDQQKIAEDTTHAWFTDVGMSLHPSVGRTEPESTIDEDGQAYTFAKAPRYDDRVVQVGPYADLVVAGDPLLSDIHRKEGCSVWARQLARLHRPVLYLQEMRRVLGELSARSNWELRGPEEVKPREGSGVGLINAARGPLGHWVTIYDGQIDNYQIVTPTGWNASPRDRSGSRGHWEQSFLGLEVPDPSNPVVVGHVVRSHDPCLVCTVHFLGDGGGHRESFPLW